MGNDQASGSCIAPPPSPKPQPIIAAGVGHRNRHGPLGPIRPIRPVRNPMTRTIVHVGRKIQVAIDESLNDRGQLVRRDVVLHPGAVAILPLLTDDHVCLVRNVRPNVGETLWEIPAGTLEPSEPVEMAAARELREETGYLAAQLEKLGEFFPSPGVLSERMHLFVARGLTAG